MLICKRTLLGGAVVLALSIGTQAAAGPHGEVHASIRILDRRIAQTPDNALLYLRRGELHRIDENWTASEADLRRALAGGLGIARRALGTMFLDAGRLEQAEAEARRFLENAPMDADGWALLARILHARDRHELAVPLWKRAATCPRGDRPDIWIQRTRAMMARGIPSETDSVLADLDRASERLRRPVTLELEALAIERTQGAWDAAIARIDRIAERARRKTAWTLLKAEVLQQAGRATLARGHFQRVLEEIADADRRGRKSPKDWAERARKGLTR